MCGGGTPRTESGSGRPEEENGANAWVQIADDSRCRAGWSVGQREGAEQVGAHAGPVCYGGGLVREREGAGLRLWLGEGKAGAGWPVAGLGQWAKRKRRRERGNISFF